MEAFQTSAHNKEAKIQKAIKLMLEKRSWFVKVTTASQYMSGFPDLFATHKDYGQRWIEVKLPGMKGSHFTKAQLKDFPQFEKHGCGIWIMTADTEREYMKLFNKSNWSTYLFLKRK